MKALVITVVIVSVSVLVQYLRYKDKTKNIQQGMAINLPISYFPFNGSYPK